MSLCSAQSSSCNVQLWTLATFEIKNCHYKPTCTHTSDLICKTLDGVQTRKKIVNYRCKERKSWHIMRLEYVTRRRQVRRFRHVIETGGIYIYLHNKLCRWKTVTARGNISKRNHRLRSGLLQTKRLTSSFSPISHAASTHGQKKPLSLFKNNRMTSNENDIFWRVVKHVRE